MSSSRDASAAGRGFRPVELVADVESQYFRTWQLRCDDLAARMSRPERMTLAPSRGADVRSRAPRPRVAPVITRSSAG